MSAESMTASHTEMTDPLTTGTNSDVEASRVPASRAGEDKSTNSDQLANQNEKATTDEYPHGFRFFVLVGAVMITVFLSSLDQTIVGTAIPKITDEFHGLSQVSWYGSAYFMCFGGFQSSWGKAYKYFPMKATFIVSVLIFEVGSLLCGVAPNPTAFIVGRAIAGVGGAGVSIGGTVIFAFCAEPEKRPTLMGFMGFSYTIATIFGPLLGGAFAERVTWRWCFYINLPLGGFALVLIFIFFRTPSTAKVIEASWKEKFLQMDPGGVILAMRSIISFVLALQYGGQSYPWNSSTVIGLLVGFVVILITLAVYDYFQGEYAMLPARLVRRRSVWAPSAFQFFFSGCYFLLLYYLPIYFQSIKGANAIQSGVDNLPMVIAGCLAILAGGITVTMTRYATPYMVVGSAIATVGVDLLYTLDVDTPSARWIGFQILVGVAIAFPFQNALNSAQANADAEDISTVTSTLYFFQILGGAFSVSAAQSAFVNRLITSLPITAPGVDPLLVVASGATELRDNFPSDQISGIILAYMDGIKASFAVAVGMAGMAFLTSFLCPWNKLNPRPLSEAAPMG
ncbi:MFS general substrate transporter [Hypoxylon crocopeplum]|nr:MFS general substrate transporter [Hypoxylon crocopeplum]